MTWGYCFGLVSVSLSWVFGVRALTTQVLWEDIMLFRRQKLGISLQRMIASSETILSNRILRPSRDICVTILSKLETSFVNIWDFAINACEGQSILLANAVQCSSNGLKLELALKSHVAASKVFRLHDPTRLPSRTHRVCPAKSHFTRPLLPGLYLRFRAASKRQPHARMTCIYHIRGRVCH